MPLAKSDIHKVYNFDPLHLVTMEILEEKKNKNIGYKPILDGIPDWPVYQLSKNRKEFLEEVTQKSMEQIKLLRPSRKQLLEELETTVFREQNRIKRNRWRVDPKDDARFWARIKSDLAELGIPSRRAPNGVD